MSNSQFDVERATAGLVMTLFVAAALLLAGLLYFVMQDMDERAADSDAERQAMRVERPSPSPSATALPNVVPVS
jgi:hypothetical protein